MKKIQWELDLETSGIRRSIKTATRAVDGMGKKIQRSMFRASKKVDGLTRSFRNTGIAAGLAATGGLYAFNRALSDTVNLANVQEAAEIKLAGVLRATGEAAGYSLPQLKAMAGELQELTTTGDETIISGMGILATFKRIKGDSFRRATKAALDMSAVMGTDLKSSILQVGKALDNPAQGMTALSRAGVTFTDQQKEQIKALQASGDLIGAQKIILKELESQFGGVAAALRGTFAGSVTAAMNVLGDLKEEMGFAITKNKFFLEGAKLVEELFKSWTTSIKENRGQWMEWAKRNTLAVLEFAADFADGINSTFKALNTMVGLLNLAWGGTITLAGGFQYLFEKSNQFFGRDEKAEYWAKAQKDSAELVITAFARADEAFKNVGTGLPGVDAAASKIRALKEELAKIEAVEVDPAELVSVSSDNVNYELKQISGNVEGELKQVGDAWVQVVKKSVKDLKTAAGESAAGMADGFNVGLVEGKLKQIGGAWVQVVKKSGEDIKNGAGKNAAGMAGSFKDGLTQMERDTENSVRDILAELDKINRAKIKPQISTSSSGDNIGGAFSTGGMLSGFGGGDQIHALLEAGEFVIRKEAVAKFGAGIFHALNSLQLPKLPGFSQGGYIAPILPQLARFATGGSVSPAPAAAAAAGPIYNLTVNLPNQSTAHARQNTRELAQSVLLEMKKMHMGSSR